MKQKRLEAICSFLDVNDKIIDVGCDHGYVAINMANKGSLNVLATDIHENALKVAQRNAKQKGLEKRIQFQLTDGLQNIEVQKYDTVVIAGMGTSTIKHILQKEYIEGIKKLVLQSNNDLAELRNHIYQIGFSISSEKIVFDHGHYYVIMLCEKKEAPKLKDVELEFGIYKEENHDYYEYCYQKYTNILKHIPWFKRKDRKAVKRKIKLLKKYL